MLKKVGTILGTGGWRGRFRPSKYRNLLRRGKRKGTQTLVPKEIFVPKDRGYKVGRGHITQKNCQISSPLEKRQKAHIWRNLIPGSLKGRYKRGIGE